MLAGFSLCFLAGSLWASPLKSDEHVLFLPDFARERPDGRMEVQVQAWVYEQERRPGMASAFAAYMGVNLDDLPPEERQVFEERARLFRTDSERRKEIEILLGDPPRIFPLPRTNKAGRSNARLILDQSIPDRPTKIPFQLKPPEKIQTRSEGFVFFIPQKGISVISDLDDTIKITEVLDRKAMLENTFFKELKPVPGMADLYGNLAAKNISFHYLSSSPVQLYPALWDFLKKEGFPEGSMHLRESTSWKTLVPGKGVSRRHKKENILRLLESFPKRRFFLIGDSAEADPEIYADIARSHPEKILGIWIRDVTDEDRESARYTTTFAGIPGEFWHIFREAPTWQTVLKTD